MKVDYIHHCGSDLTVVNAARVSFDKESEWGQCETFSEGCDGTNCICKSGPKLTQRDTKLIQYLARHQHTSPFNHSFLTVRVKAPIFVARQLVKHKFMPWNEISRRYVDSEPEFYEPDVWRKRADDKKQGSSDETVSWDDISYAGSGGFIDYHECCAASLEMYHNMLEADVCPEQARMVLPQSVYTEWYWSGTLGAWLDMLKLRLKEDTQWETKEVAKMCAKIIQPLFPVAYEAVLG